MLSKHKEAPFPQRVWLALEGAREEQVLAEMARLEIKNDEDLSPLEANFDGEAVKEGNLVRILLQTPSVTPKKKGRQAKEALPD